MAGRIVIHRVAGLAERQHGVVGRAQLVALGFTRHQIEDRGRDGVWQRLWPGVYAIGHAPLTRHGWLMAAVLACGEDAVLSHRSAAELWELLPGRAGGHQVTIRSEGARRTRQITVHRRPGSVPSTLRYGIPVTTPAQTILDAAVQVGRRGTERMIDQADRRRLCTYPDLCAAVEASSGQRGTGVVRLVIDEHEGGSTVTRSHLEELFLALCRRHGFSPPWVNVEVEGLTVDFYWPEHRVAVETDGWSSHRPRERFSTTSIEATGCCWPTSLRCASATTT